MGYALFPLGRIVITRNALDTLNPEDVKLCIARHAGGDWGELLEEGDRRENDRAVEQGLRIFSAYRDRSGTKFWAISEHDRSVTTVLLPEDY